MRIGLAITALTAVLGGALKSAAAEPIEYVVKLDAPQTQMVEIEMRVPDVRGESLEVALPVWRPGRYDVLDSAGGVRDVQAQDGQGRSLKIGKIDKSTWRVDVSTERNGTVRVSYRVYCNELGSRTRHVDDTHAFLSGSSVFFYVPSRRNEQIHVHIEAPAEWKVASGLESMPSALRTLLAANYDVLVDSPIEVGLHDMIEFEVQGKLHQIVIWGEADYDAEELKTDFAKIVQAQAEIFGQMPYERYVFLTHVGSGMGGGTEHLNSTIMQTRRAALEDESAYKRFLGLVSHEFFHTWNVKQLRPAGIQQYDYARENYTKLLWVCEGTTSYYDDLTRARTGLLKTDDYTKRLAGAVGSMRDRPGTYVQSLEESSFDAWIKFNTSTPDSVNSTVSFYSNGAMVSLALDMELRHRTENRVTLDTLMRKMYERFPLGGGGYVPQDLVEVASELCGADLDPFFAKYVRGTGVPDFESLLQTVGLELTFKRTVKGDEAQDNDETDKDDAPAAPAEPALKAYIGLNLSSGTGGASVRTVLADGPAYDIGILPGDEIVALSGRRLRASELDSRLKKLAPGDVVTLHVMRRDELRVFEVTLDGKPDGTWTIKHVKEPTEAQIQAYESWINQDWPERKKDPISKPAAAAAPADTPND